MIEHLLAKLHPTLLILFWFPFDIAHKPGSRLDTFSCTSPFFVGPLSASSCAKGSFLGKLLPFLGRFFAVCLAKSARIAEAGGIGHVVTLSSISASAALVETSFFVFFWFSTLWASKRQNVDRLLAQGCNPETRPGGWCDLLTHKKRGHAPSFLGT